MSKALKAAIESNDPEAVRKALKSVKDMNRKMPGARTPLLYACEKGADEVLEVLFEAGAIAEKKHTFPDDTPFAVAAKFKKAKVLERLLALRQASTNAVEHAIREAAIGGKAAALDLVLNLVKPPITITHFNMVSHAKNVGEMLGVLVKHGGDVNIRTEKGEDKGATPLHKAASGRHDVLRALVEYGADVNARDERGQTPLMSLAEELEWIERSESESVALRSLETLLELGANATLVDNWGSDSLAFCEWEYMQSEAKLNPKFEATLRNSGAVGLGANIDLLKAVVRNDVNGMKVALSSGADARRRYPQGGFALNHARSEDVIDVLLEAGADVNQGLPLIGVARAGNLPLVKKLIAAGADVNAVDMERSYPYNAYVAAETNSKYEVVDYLKSLGASKPMPKETVLLKAGVESWNDFSEVLAKADVLTTATALGRMIGGKVELDACGKSFTPGDEAYVVVRPKGMDWCNIFRLAPPRLRFEDCTENAEFAQALAKAAGTSVLSIAYSDTSDAAEVLRAEADGSSSRDDGWDRSTLEEMVENLGDEAPSWAKEQLAKTSEDDPTSTERLVMLAERESFVVAAFGIYCEPGRKLDVDFTGYGAESFDAVAFVST